MKGQNIFLHVNLCILIRIEEKDKNVTGFIPKIKDLRRKLLIMLNIHYDVDLGNKGMGIELPTFKRHVWKSP